MGDEDYWLNVQENGSIDVFLPQHISSWSKHVLSWLDEPALPCFLVRYEDLLEDTAAQLKRIMHFCNVPWEEDRARAAIRSGSFKVLGKEEEARGFKDKPPNAPAFFHKGTSGQWRDSLHPDLARQICQTHGHAMRRLGYAREVEEVLERGRPGRQ